MTSPAARGEARRPGLGRLAHATVWAVVMDSGGQVSTLVVSTVLAAMLGPEAYGLVAMALVYVTFVQMLQQQGMQSAVIQRFELDDRHKDTAFWLVAAASLALTGLSVAGAPWWASVNRQPMLEPLLVALSALLPIRGLVVVQEAVVRRSMRFRGLAVRTLVSVAVGGVLGVGAALAGYGVWALVIQQVSTALVGLVILWSLSSWRPRLRFSRGAARDLLGFSSGSFLSSIAVFVNNRADALLIGLFFGPLVVGLYRFGSRLVEAVLAMTVRPLQSVALPEFSRHQRDLAELRRSFLRLARLSAWCALPALGVLAGAADLIVAILGDEWDGAQLPLQLLCVAGVVKVAASLGGPMLQARGRVFLQASTSWVAAVVSAVSFTLAALALAGSPVSVQAAGLAATRVAVWGSIVLGLNLWLVRRVTRVSWRSLVRAYWPAAAVATAAAGVTAGADLAVVTGGGGLALRIAIVGAISLLVVASVATRYRELLARRRHGDVVTKSRDEVIQPAEAVSP